MSDFTRTYKNSEQHDNLVSISYQKYRDARMPWVGQLGQTPFTLAVTDVSQVVCPAIDSRVWIALTNDGASTIYLALGGRAAVANSQLRLNPNGGNMVFDNNMPWPNIITAICGAGLTSTLLICDVQQVTEGGRGE